MNHSGCLKAYRGEVIELDPGAPLVCPECGKPLTKGGGGAQSAIKVAAILASVLVFFAGAFVVFKVLQKRGGVLPKDTPGEIASATPEPSPIDSTPPTPVATTDTPPAPIVDEPPPAPPASTDEAVTPDVRQEVLTRIDKMPNLTPEKKDRLYNSVQRARDMRKVVEIYFGSGQIDMPKTSVAQVKKLLEEPGVMKFRDDLTAVFVVLGFADTKGDEKKNYKVSEQRADSVVRFMEKDCGVKNVTHAVAMGGTSLVDKNNAAKNRVAEIWAVLP
jgi:outer membrane protein OmpA-like peptidoglycan-associated protein